VGGRDRVAARGEDNWHWVRDRDDRGGNGSLVGVGDQK
jgi:hypothetical protein